MGRGNGESITANAMTSRPTNVTKTNQYLAFVAYRRKEVCMHRAGRKVACTYPVSLAAPSARCAPVLRGSQNSSLRFFFLLDSLDFFFQRLYFAATHSFFLFWVYTQLACQIYQERSLSSFSTREGCSTALSPPGMYAALFNRPEGEEDWNRGLQLPWNSPLLLCLSRLFAGRVFISRPDESRGRR